MFLKSWVCNSVFWSILVTGPEELRYETCCPYKKETNLYCFVPVVNFYFDLQELGTGIVGKVFFLTKLNVDVLFSKICSKTRKLWPLWKLGKSTLPQTAGRGLHLLASMATRSTIWGWAMKRGESKLSTRKRTSFVAALEAKNEHIFPCCTCYTNDRGLI